MKQFIKTIKDFSKKNLKKYYALGFYFFSQTAFASSSGGGDMPWNSPLDKLRAALSGTTAHTLVLISIVLLGLAFASGEYGGLIKKGIAIVIGGAIAVGATDIYNALNISGALI